MTTDKQTTIWWHLYLDGGESYGGCTRFLYDALDVQQFYEYEGDQSPAWLEMEAIINA